MFREGLSLNLLSFYGWTVMVSQQPHLFYSATKCTFKEEICANGNLEYQMCRRLLQVIHKTAVHHPARETPGAPSSHCLSDSIAPWVSASNLTKTKRLEETRTQKLEENRTPEPSKIRCSLHHKAACVSHITVIGQRYQSKDRKRERSSRKSQAQDRNFAQIPMHKWKEMIPSVQGQHHRSMLDRDSKGALLRIQRM